MNTYEKLKASMVLGEMEITSVFFKQASKNVRFVSDLIPYNGQTAMMYIRGGLKGTDNFVASLGTQVRGNVHAVDGSDVRSALRGLGYGRKIYGRAIRTTFEDYLKGGPRWFTSDHSGRTSPSAVRVWESLRKRGYPVIEKPVTGSGSKFGIDLEEMKSFYGRPKSVK